MLLQAGVLLLCLMLRHQAVYYRYRGSAEALREEMDSLHIATYADPNAREPPPAVIETPSGSIARDVSVTREARDVDDFYRTLLDPKVRTYVTYSPVDVPTRRVAPRRTRVRS